MVKKVIFISILVVFAILMAKTLLWSPESIQNLNKKRKFADSLSLELIKLELKRVLLSYETSKLTEDTGYLIQMFRKMGRTREGEAYFIINDDSIILIYDRLE